MTEIAVLITYAGAKRLRATYLSANVNLKDVSFISKNNSTKLCVEDNLYHFVAYA